VYFLCGPFWRLLLCRFKSFDTLRHVHFYLPTFRRILVQYLYFQVQHNSTKSDLKHLTHSTNHLLCPEYEATKIFPTSASIYELSQHNIAGDSNHVEVLFICEVSVIRSALMLSKLTVHMLSELTVHILSKCGGHL
jgi:hypothetical protein